jgi:hypothetical protein
VRLRESAIARGVGVGLACLQASPVARAQTMATAYAVGHALDPHGFEVVSVNVVGQPDWVTELARIASGGASWVAIHSLLTPLARRSAYPLPLVALGYAVTEAVTDSLAAHVVTRLGRPGAAPAPAAEPS